MNKTRNLTALLALIVFLLIVGFSIYKWIRFNTIDGGSLLFGFLALSYLFNWLNWGQRESKKDELDRHIETQSARIGIMY